VSVETLREIGPPAKTAVPALIWALGDVRYIRSTAADALRAIGPESVKTAVPALVRLLKDDDAEVRSAAIKALKVIEPQAAKQAGIN
jgi:HEAT repeat protein